MKLNDYLEQGEELYQRGHATDGCTFVGWLVHRFWPDAENACWSHDFARNGLIKVTDQSENDNLFKDALKHFNVPRPVRFLMYTFTKSQGFMKDKFNMSLAAFMGFIFFLLVVAGMFYASSLQADPRIENRDAVCHSPWDPDDDDDEEYLQACKSGRIATPLEADGTRRAYGSYDELRLVDILDLIEEGRPQQTVKLIGPDTDPAEYPDHVQTNFTCAMVTYNYNAGANADNRTEYTTGDWNLQQIYLPLKDTNRPTTIRVRYTLRCRGGEA